MESILATKGPAVITISPETSVHDAVAILVEQNIGAVVVVDSDHRPVGILSERDLIREANAGPGFLDRPAASVMTRDVVCGSPGDDVDAVLQTMTAHHFRHLPIIEAGALIGIVSIGDLVKAQLDQYRGDIETLQTQLMNS